MMRLVSSVASTLSVPDMVPVVLARRALVVYCVQTTPIDPVPASPFLPVAPPTAAPIETIMPPRVASMSSWLAVTEVAPSMKASVVPIAKLKPSVPLTASEDLAGSPALA